ncbi:MAG: molybdenum cofactor biosynthesis protein MoeB, partial [Rhodothermaceae bacterium]|nr:molybdenum cofactor biosynthesis protein MoeB [Rhodothermaceae bacterium]
MSGLSENYVPEITVQDLKQLLDENKRPFILDVREESEYIIANLGGHLIPLGELVD